MLFGNHAEEYNVCPKCLQNIMLDPSAHLNTYGDICSINSLSLSLWECIILLIIWCTALTVWGPSDSRDIRIDTFCYTYPAPPHPTPTPPPTSLPGQPIYQIEFVTPRCHPFTKQLRNTSFWVIYYTFAMVACKMQLITKCYMLHTCPLPAGNASPSPSHTPRPPPTIAAAAVGLVLLKQYERLYKVYV